LHVLITERHPYAPKTSTHTQLIRAVLTDDASLASESIEAASFKRWVRGDLDAIIAKAIQREPALRYATAAELAADLRRFLSYRPVLAKSHTVTQRALMLGRRNRVWAYPIVGGVLLIAALTVGAISWRDYRHHAVAVGDAVTIPAHSVAVLPFVDMSEKRDQEYFSDGLSEELIDQLTKVRDLAVPARTSSFSFKGKQATIADIGKALGVANVLEGSVRKSGDKLRVSAQLIRVDNGFHVWSETYDRNAPDIFQIQSEIAAAVVKALKISLLGGELSDSAGTRNVQANDLYHEANFIYEQQELDSIPRSIALFKAALTLDPSFAQGWASLSRAELYAWFGSSTDDPQRALSLDSARRAAARAVSLDPDLSDGHVVRGRIFLFADEDFSKAEIEFRRALELNPRNSYALIQQSYIAGQQGRHNDQLRLAAKALALDPLNPTSLDTSADLAYHSGNLKDAEHLFRKLRDVSPRFGIVQRELGKVLLARGRPREALAEFQRASDADDKHWGEALAFYELDRVIEADRALMQLESSRSEAPYMIALVYAYRGEADKTFAWLDRQYQIDPTLITRMRVLEDPLMDKMERDLRYRTLWQKMKIPPIVPSL
jgi:TolB-like protein/Flp pilus assembly protein TadD